MSYQCPKGHISTDPDYCSECGAKLGQTAAPTMAPGVSKPVENTVKEEICPDCGTPRVSNARFCEVCRHDFVDGKTGTAEKVVEASKAVENQKPVDNPVKAEDMPPAEEPAAAESNTDNSAASNINLNTATQDNIVIAEKLNVVISVDKERLAQNDVETNIKPDIKDRVFPLDLDENLVGRRSAAKGIYPEIEINDPGVSHRHLKYIKQPDGKFAVLELGSANGTELNGTQLEAGINTVIKPGDKFAIGLWTTLEVVQR